MSLTQAKTTLDESGDTNATKYNITDTNRFVNSVVRIENVRAVSAAERGGRARDVARAARRDQFQ